MSAGTWFDSKWNLQFREPTPQPSVNRQQEVKSMPAFISLLINIIILAICAYGLIWVVGLIGIAIPAIIVKLILALFVLYGLALVVGFLRGETYVPGIWR